MTKNNKGSIDIKKFHYSPLKSTCTMSQGILAIFCPYFVFAYCCKKMTMELYDKEGNRKMNTDVSCEFCRGNIFIP